jgi:hypothetical protein
MLAGLQQDDNLAPYLFSLRNLNDRLLNQESRQRDDEKLGLSTYTRAQEMEDSVSIRKFIFTKTQKYKNVAW